MNQIITPAGAGKILSEDEIRAEDCNNAIQQVLSQFRCIMVPFFHMEPGMGAQIGVRIQAAPKVDPETMGAAGEILKQSAGMKAAEKAADDGK
jgi:hypothetical protein